MPTNPPRPGNAPSFKPKTAIALAALMVILSGAGSLFYQVNQDQAGVVQRFGKYVRTTQPGLQMKLPFGIETVTMVRVTHVFKEEFGFRSELPGVRTIYQNASDYQRGGPRGGLSGDPYLQESLMLTGDLNVAEVEWIVQYKIKDPVQYAFKIRDQRETLRNMSEAVMRLVIGDHTISEVLTSGREEIQQEVEKKLQSILDSYGAGISITNVILQEVMPPNEVKASFNEVNEARQEKEKLVNQAWAQYNTIIPRAKGEAEQQIRNAEGYALERTNQAKGDADRFKLTVEAYKKFPAVTRRRLYLEMIQKTYPTLKDKLVLDSNQKNILPLLDLYPKEGA